MTMYKFNRLAWWFWIYLIRILGGGFLLSPQKLPTAEKHKLYAAAVQPDVLIVFNPGGWGDATLEKAADFIPILEGIRKTLVERGYRTGLVQYTRTLPNLAGRISGTKEQLNVFKHSCPIQASDIRYVAESFPDKQVVLAGFSTGGGLAAKTLKSLADCPNVCGIMVGVPGWFPTYSSPETLVLDNSGRDPVSCGRVYTIAATVFKAPVFWIYSNLKGRKISLALSLQLPDHEYLWSSPEVGAPIVKFLESRFPAKIPQNQAS